MRGHVILRDHLSRDAEDVRRRTVILRQRHANGRRVLPGLPASETLQKKLETSERSATKSVNSLIVVTHHHDVSRLRRKQKQQLQLCDIRVLKLVHQNMFEPLLETLPNLGIIAHQLD